MLFFILFIIAGIIFDQVTKFLAITFLEPVWSIPIIPHIFHLTYVKNDGAAFSLLSGKQAFLIIVTILFIVIVAYFFARVPKNKRYFNLNLAFSMILCGAFGNLIDRVRQGYVVDFFDVRILGFAIFNIADVYVVVGCILLVLSIMRNHELLADDNDIFSLPGKRKDR